MSRERYQVAIDEIAEVCKKHRVVLLGTCNTKGMYGEITIVSSDLSDNNWYKPEEQVDSEVVYYDSDYSVERIGEITK